jgi:NADPH:quinone reductase-like Zn-dependent oxidoreductase
LPDLLAALWPVRAGRKEVFAGPAAERPEYAQELAELAKAGMLRPGSDRCYTFAQMAEAHAYVETRRKRGSVVVHVDHEG